MHFSNYDITAAQPTRRPVVLEGEMARLQRQSSRSLPSSKPTVLSRPTAWIRTQLLKIGAQIKPDAISASGRA